MYFVLSFFFPFLPSLSILFSRAQEAEVKSQVEWDQSWRICFCCCFFFLFCIPERNTFCGGGVTPACLPLLALPHSADVSWATGVYNP